MDELERDIRRFVSEKVGVGLDRIHLTSPLGRDLGLDGDDAIEFFGAYTDTFQVDITALQAEWSEFFGPEGVSLSGGLILVLPFVASAILVIFAGWPSPVISIIVGVALMLAWRLIRFWPCEKLFPLPREITVAELIEAVRRGRWR